jgi:hypothetical protein
VHLTLGILRKSQAVFNVLAFFQLDGFAVPAPAQVTQTVGRLFRVIVSQPEINIVILINYEIQELLHRVLCLGCYPFGNHARLRICTSVGTSL